MTKPTRRRKLVCVHCGYSRMPTANERARRGQVVCPQCGHKHWEPSTYSELRDDLASCETIRCDRNHTGRYATVLTGMKDHL